MYNTNILSCGYCLKTHIDKKKITYKCTIKYAMVL